MKSLFGGKVSRYFSVAFSLAVLLFLSGCFTSSAKVQFRYKNEDIVAKADNLRRTGKIYRDLDTILIGDILWYSADLKKAYLDEMRSKKRVDEADFENNIQIIENHDAKGVDFLVAVYTAEKKWDDFALPSSIWKFRMEGKDGELVAPFEITRIKQENIPDTHIFSFITTWRSVYRVRFPRNESIAGLGKYEIKLYSILGDTAFVWYLDEAERAKPASADPPIAETSGDGKAGLNFF